MKESIAILNKVKKQNSHVNIISEPSDSKIKVITEPDEDDGYDEHLTMKLQKNFDHLKSI